MTITTDRVAAVCRDCGTLFWDLSGHGLCDACTCERVNGAGELELDDPDDVINRPQPTFHRSYALCDGVKITGAQLREACHAWQMGSAALGSWAVRNKCIRQYGALVLAVRAHLNDQIDYSQESA